MVCAECLPDRGERISTMSGTLTIETLAGLANRMRALDSAYGLAEKFDKPLILIWPIIKKFNCPFESLFALPDRVVTLKQPNYFGFGGEMVRRLSLKLDRFRYDAVLDLRVKVRRRRGIDIEQIDFERIVADNDAVKITAGARLYFPEKPYRELTPVAELQKRIADLRRQLGDDSIGVHIRRTDHKLSIQNSPTELFVDAITRELDADGRRKVFLATDSPEEEAKLRKIFGDRIVVHEHKRLNRNDPGGIQDALVDLYTLSATGKIYGSFLSTFGETASEIGGIPIEVLKK